MSVNECYNSRLFEFLVQKSSGTGNPTQRTWLRFTDVYKASLMFDYYFLYLILISDENSHLVLPANRQAVSLLTRCLR